MKRLTDEQRKLAADNHNLIYCFAHNNHISLADYYDILAIGLCKAAASYDKNKSKFSTFAIRCMSNEFASATRHITRKNAIPKEMIEHQDCIIDDISGEMTSKEFIDEYSGIELSSNVIVNDFLESLDEKERVIVEFLISGMTHKEISDKMNCTRQNIGFCVKKIRNKFINFMS